MIAILIESAVWAADHTILLMAATAVVGVMSGLMARICTIRLTSGVRAWNTRAQVLATTPTRHPNPSDQQDHPVQLDQPVSPAGG